MPPAVAFLILFVAYQLPEGLGGRLLHSFPAQAGLMLAFLPIAWWVGRRLGPGAAAYALERRPGWLRTLIALLALAVAVRVGALALGTWLGSHQVALQFPAARSLGLGLAVAAISTFVPSLAEDIVTRGFWYRQFLAGWPARSFVLASSAIYVLNHVYRLGAGPAEWGLLFCFGLAYATALARTGTLWAAVGLHWGWNLANALLDLVARVEALQPAASRLLSGAAHLLLLAIVLAFPRRFVAGREIIGG